MKIKSSSLVALIENSIPPIPEPSVELEQYTTPGELAAKLAIHAKLSGALEGSIIADLGAGTCRLLIPFLILGGSKGYAVEADARLAPYCIEAASSLGISDKLVYIVSRISGNKGPLNRRIDIVVTNPPFGVWRKGADWDILEYALSVEPDRVYAILKSGNIEYHTQKALKRGYSVRVLDRTVFPIPASMVFHKSRIRRVMVDVLLFEKTDGGSR